MADRKISKTKLCSLTGIARTTLDAILNGSDAKISTVEAIASAIGVNMSFLFDEEITIDDHSAHAETGGHAQSYDMRGSTTAASVPDCDVATLKAEIAHLNALLAEKERFIKHLLGEK